MSTRHAYPILLSAALLLSLVCRAEAAAPKTEIKGTAILDHPCGKVAVQHMGLVHAGKMEEATKLGTKEMQDSWKALPDKDRTMMAGMMKEMSVGSLVARGEEILGEGLEGARSLLDPTRSSEPA